MIVLCPRRIRTLCYVLLTGLCCAASARAADLDDFFDAEHLAKYLKTSSVQNAQLAPRVEQVKTLVGDYQRERDKRTCDAILWQGHIPHVQALRAMRKNTRDSIKAVIDTMKTVLDKKQAERLDKLLSGKDNILDYAVAQTPFYHINNSPLFPEFTGKTTAYHVVLPGSPDPDMDWTYAQLLKLWTVRGYIPSVAPTDDVQQTPGIADQPDLQVRALPASERVHIARSPLLIAATLLVPDLGKAEYNLLHTYYSPDSTDITTWEAYTQQNQLNDAIQVRLKLNTPYDKAYLDLSRWIIYLEDSDGVGYEPKQVKERAFFPLEAVRITVPGQEVEVTDVFGNYFSPIPGDKANFYLQAPEEQTYVGNEKLLQLYFPGRDFQGNPVVKAHTQYLKLIVQSQETDYGRCELVWDIKRPESKVHPPKD